MAAPHVSGAAALLRQLHPDWRPSEIKAVLMNTAVETYGPDGQPNPLAREGAGRIDVAAAARQRVIAQPASLSFGYVAAGETQRLQTTVQLRNFSAANLGLFDVHVEKRGDVANAFDLTLPKSVMVTPLGGLLPVSVKVDPSRLPDRSGGPDPLLEAEAVITLTPRAGFQDEAGGTIRLPVYFLPQGVATSAVTSSGRGGETTVTIRNRGAATATWELFQFGANDGRERDFPAEADLRAVGARSYPADGVVEFGLGTWDRWLTPNGVEYDVYIDTNQDGAPDYVLFNIDLGLLYGVGYLETPVTALWDLNQGLLVPEFYVTTGGQYATNVIGLPVALADMGLTPGAVIGYQIYAFDYDSEAVDFLDSLGADGWLSFDTGSNGFRAEALTVQVAPGGSTRVKVWSGSDADGSAAATSAQGGTDIAGLRPEMPTSQLLLLSGTEKRPADAVETVTLR